MDSLSRQRTDLDRLSALPEEILIQIVNLLPCKQAVSTSILASPWRYAWRFVPDLEFDDSCLNRGCYELNRVWWFLVSINRALMYRETPIRRFSLTCHHPCNSACLAGWIASAVNSGVRVVNLNLNSKYLQPVPSLLFTCISLTKLILIGGIEICITNHSISLPNLKYLMLDRVRFVGFGSIERILLACPVLENLDIRRRWDDKEVTLNITVPTLKFLSYTFYQCDCEVDSSSEEEEGEEEFDNIDILKVGNDNVNNNNNHIEEEEDLEYSLIISAPNLEDVYINDKVTDKYIVNGDVWTWLDDAYLNVREDATVLDLVIGISNANSIALSSSTLGCLSRENVLPTFYNLIKLELGISNACLEFVNEFLERSPNLEILVFEKECDDFMYQNPCWIAPLFIPICFAINLRKIIFEKFFGDEHEVDLIEYLLRNGEALEHVTIRCPKYVSFDIRFMIEEFPRNCELTIIH